MKRREFSYAKVRKEKKSRRKWYMIETENYECAIWTAMLIPIVKVIKFFITWRDKKRVWDADKATKLLTYYILPQNLTWNEEKNAYYYCCNWYTAGFMFDVPHRYKKWANKFTSEIEEFLKFEYQNPKYVKEFEIDNYDCYWVKFTEK